MTKNKDLARKVLAVIKDDQEHWDQNSWAYNPDIYRSNSDVCNTQYCFGGWAAVLSGAKFSLKTGEWRDRGGHRIKDFGRFAARKLGLNADEATAIFFYFPRGADQQEKYDDFEQRVREVFEL